MTKTWDDMRGDIIDSRDVIERLAELEDAASDEPTDIGCNACGEGSMPDGEIEALCTECAAELRTLRDFAEQGESAASDWQYGEAFIPEDKFTDYAEQLAEDVGAIPRDAAWPASYIDWDAAAEALKVDYTTIEVEGETYYAR